MGTAQVSSPYFLSSPLSWHAKADPFNEEVDVLKRTPIIVTKIDVIEQEKIGRFVRGGFLSII